MAKKYRDRRLERCQSWIDQAGQHQDNPDVAFICLWIAFNALYGYEWDEARYRNDGEFRSEFFQNICSHDEGKTRIYNLIWKTYSDSIRTLMNNPFVYKNFWKYRNEEIDAPEYGRRKRKDESQINKAMSQQDTALILKKLFERLYVLRNQIMHGGATYGSHRNRDSVGDGHKILLNLVPLFLEIITENPDIDLGKPYYFAEDK